MNAETDHKKQALLKQLERLSEVMDNNFSIGGFKFGVDALIGLLPVGGDTLGGLISLYIIFKGYQAGVSKATVNKMFLLVLIDVFIGSISLIGDLFDFFFKVNERNIALIKQDLLRG